MIWWWVPWFLKALGVSATVLFIGWLLPKRKPEPVEPEEMLWSKEYRQMYEDAIKDMEWLYQK